MNRIYRLVWNRVSQTWVVVSERTKGKGKSANRRLIATALLATTHVAMAGPIGGQVTAGSGTISQRGNTTTVTQSSQNLSLGWQSFNTSSQETVNFVQPSASAVAVNRISDTNATQFFGHLNANGQVYLINPNGVLFGAGSQINVGGLVASTLDINDASINSATRNFSGTGTGSIVNEGRITAANGGYVAFIGNTVRNQGTINAPAGAVAQGAGSDVTLSFSGDSLVKLQVNQSTLNNLAENGGLIQADRGAVWLSAGAKDAVLASVINNTGIIQARSVQNVGGSIVLEAGPAGTATNNGTLDASGAAAGQVGGTVKVLGGSVKLAAGSTVDVSGDAGGGTALIGGNYQGGGSEQRAIASTVEAGALLNADAVTNGKGGTAVVWSDGNTQFNGRITARGGAQSGHGGQVETSGTRLNIDQSASVDTSAAHGNAGDWLLDPEDINIGSQAIFGGSTYTVGGVTRTVDVDSAVLTNALNFGNVTIKTTAASHSCTVISCPTASSGNGDINVLDYIGAATASGGNVVKWMQNNYTLTLSAYRDINFKYLPTYSTGGSIYTYENPNGGQVVLRADNSATGTGRVLMDDPSINGFQLSDLSHVSIYYNPTSFSAPSDFSQYVMPLGTLGSLTTYMLVNYAGTVADKVYDGTTSVVLNTSPSTILPTGVTLSTNNPGAGFSDKNVGQNKTVNISGVTFSNGSNIITYNGNNYFINGLDNKTAAITAKALTLTGITALDKTYDASTTATLNTNNVSYSGIITGDVVSLSGTGTGAFASKNAGSNKTVTVSGYTLSGTDAGNYVVMQPTGLSASITKADLIVSGVTAADKTYDATTAATLAGTASVTALSSDMVSVTGAGTGTFADANAGTNKAVTVTGYSLTGTDAGNYNLVQPTGVNATINKADVILHGTKTYDGTTTVAGSSLTAIGVAGQTFSITGSGDTSNLSSKNVQTGSLLSSTTGLSLGTSSNGGLGSNYNVLGTGASSFTVTPKSIALAGITATDKTYDATTTATLNTSGVSFNGLINGDSVALSGSGVGSFANKNADVNKTVTVSGYTLSGTDAGNYVVAQPTGLTASITKANLSLTGLSAIDKVYNATTAATLSGTPSLSGAIGGDAVSLSGTGTGIFSDKNVGTQKTVAISGYTLTGTDAGNYSIVNPSGLTASITPASVTVSGITAADKVYDGTTAATVNASNATLAGKLGSDVITVSATGVFFDATVGTGKTVNLTSTYGGADVGNYSFTGQSTASASITTPSAVVRVDPPVVAPIVAAPQQVQNTVTQVQSTLLPPQASAQPQAFDFSSTLVVQQQADSSGSASGTERSQQSNGHPSLNTSTGFGTPAPMLQIQNGGMRLPLVATSTTE